LLDRPYTSGRTHSRHHKVKLGLTVNLAATKRLAGMTERFTTLLDCVDGCFIPDGTLDELPLPSRLGATRVGGLDPNKFRIRAMLHAILALAVAPDGVTVTDLATKVHAMTGHAGHTTRQAAYDLRKLRRKQLIDKPGRSHRYYLSPSAARTITNLQALRDQVIGPILAGVRVPRRGRPPTTWTRIDRDYETLRRDMHALFTDLGITTTTAAA
jgi:hypothetical protein